MTRVPAMKLLPASPRPLWKYGFIPFALFAFACREQIKNNSPETKPVVRKAKLIKKPPSSFNDTLIITYKSAVFYSPDSLQLEKIQMVNEKNVMAYIKHDCYYQMQNARLSLKNDWPKVKIIEVSRARYLSFVKSTGAGIVIDLNEKNDICGLFLFDGKQDPVLVDMPNVDTFLNQYFNK
jgi:hypothetical protein